MFPFIIPELSFHPKTGLSREGKHIFLNVALKEWGIGISEADVLYWVMCAICLHILLDK